MLRRVFIRLSGDFLEGRGEIIGFRGSFICFSGASHDMYIYLKMLIYFLEAASCMGRFGTCEEAGADSMIHEAAQVGQIGKDFGHDGLDF